ncbi:unnamed protein product [Somion occarium]|uniref:Mediator of RNA polymerase II transcription subunit 7 n=1 Tax=Somion occarium TaxID=3059160 RepID=A0ABP1CHI1_9APHY
MEEEEAELRNPFPSPPSHYKNYTTHNLQLLSLLRERAGDGDLSSFNQYEALSDQTDVPDWPLIQLEKPRVDWIVEDDSYNVFGDTWYVKETIPSLAELGGTQLYSSDPNVDRRPALLAVLRSLLITFSRLLNALLAPPPTALNPEPPDWERHVEWINVLAQNVMAAANDLRPVQARGNLEIMMRRQLELRREETKKIHEKCDALEGMLEDMRKSTQQMGSDEPPGGDTDKLTEVKNALSFALKAEGISDLSQRSNGETKPITDDDVFRWAEEIG